MGLLLSQGTDNAVALRGRGFLRAAPCRGRNTRKARSKQTRTAHNLTPPNYPNEGPTAPSTATPTPTSWKTDECHRTFRPMRKRHHSAKSCLAGRGSPSASGAHRGSRVFSRTLPKGLGGGWRVAFCCFKWAFAFSVCHRWVTCVSRVREKREAISGRKAGPVN